MITACLTGNLGNHMWNYAICRIVAEKKGYDWGICPTPSHDYYSGKSQMYFMNIDYGKEVKVIGTNTNGLYKFEGISNEYYGSSIHHSYNGDNCLINMYDPSVFDIPDNTMIHITSQSEEYLIERKKDVLSWFNIREENIEEYENKLKELNIVLDENTCVINFRGGEYNSVPNLIPPPYYWHNCISYMRDRNPSMGFIIITDDINTASMYVGNNIRCIHIDVGFDFYVVNRSKYLILSNSSFSWWAAWLNINADTILAPKYWGRFTVSNGYWSLGDSYTSTFTYVDRHGSLFDYSTCKEEAIFFYKKNNLM